MKVKNASFILDVVTVEPICRFDIIYQCPITQCPITQCQQPQSDLKHQWPHQGQGFRKGLCVGIWYLSKTTHVCGGSNPKTHAEKSSGNKANLRDSIAVAGLDTLFDLRNLKIEWTTLKNQSSVNAQIGSKLWMFFSMYDLEIWRMTTQNNRAPHPCS